jgi:N-acetylmuramoyl-L-alanine amidase
MPNALRLILLVSCVAAVGAMVYGLLEPGLPAETAPEPTSVSFDPFVAAPASSSTDLPPPPAPLPALPLDPIPTVAPSAAPPHVGIVAGHWGHDTGAVCPDGLTEVEINMDVAKRVVYILQALGYQADLLEEFDSRLEDYRADALISIHADSCRDYPNATPPASGFKVASVEDSLSPGVEARLVSCLAQCYAARTGMYFHVNSITPDMSYYHTFYEINGQTPGVIIETGFMMKDRQMLTERADLVAQGIVDGIVCFIDPEP